MKTKSKRVEWLLAIGVLVIVAVFAVLLSNGREPGSPASTAIVTAPASDSSGLAITYENTPTAQQGSKLTIPIGLSGATATNKIAGVYIKLTSLPAYLSNPVISVNQTGWNKNQSTLANGEVSFSTEGVSSPITADFASFATITFDVTAVPSNDAASIEAVISDGNIPSRSHVVPVSAINIEGVFPAPTLSLVSNSPISLPAQASSISFEVGVSGMTTNPGQKLTGMMVDFQGLSSQFTSCTASTTLTSWTVTTSSIQSGMLRVTAAGSSNPLTATTNQVITLNCNLSAQLTITSVNVVGQANTDDQKLYNLDTKAIVINQTPIQTTYTISGTVTGEVVSGVVVTCGTNSATTDSSGAYNIMHMSSGTTCVLTPTRTGYTFTPATRTVSIGAADVTGQNFTSAHVPNCSDKGKDFAGDPNAFEIADVYELDKRLLKLSTGTTSDINGDVTFNHSDVISMAQCWACLWDWTQCGQ